MRNTTLRLLVLGSTFVFSAAAIHAQECVFPATPNAIVVTQPNGERLSLHFRGAPPDTWYEDEQGLPVLSTERGYVYARESAGGQLTPTQFRVGSVDPLTIGIRAHVVAPRAAQAGPKGTPTSAGPRGAFLMGSGSVKNLVLLLRFSNHGPSGQNRTLPTTANVDTIMNAVGGDPTLAPTGSVRDHYLETSYDQFTIDSVATSWLDMPNTETYYANGNSGLTTRTWELITAGLNAADATVNFSDYDVDGDGWVDAITFLHSGYGAEWGGTDSYGTNYVDRMWSHKWEIPVWTSAEGVKVSDYNISPALWGTSGSAPGRIGVVCHELGHFFGLPDLYDTDGTSQGIGNWCLMAGGAWGFGGSQQYPSHMSAWSKQFLGWVTPQVILPGAQSAPQVELSPTILRIDSGYAPGEYLLVENRQATGFDGMIPQSGLAIWHADSGKGSMTANSPNNDEGYPGQSGWPGNAKHYRIGLLQADGLFDMEHNTNRGDSGDIYRAGGVANIDNTTTPSTSAYQNGTIIANGNRLQSIGATGPTMTFTYSNSTAPTVTTASAPNGVEGVAYSLSLASSGGGSGKTWMEFRDAPQYQVDDLGPAAFTNGGTAQNWNADDGVWTLTLPFAFPYYERSYTKVYVSSNGFLDFAPTDAEAANRSDWLRASLRVAAIWDDLRTDVGAENIFVDTTTPGRVRIRWAAEDFALGMPCNFAISLFSNGQILFEYGSGNSNLTPTVGISRGFAGDFEIPSTHNGHTSLTNANRLQFTLQGSQIPPGLTLSSAGLLSGMPTVPGDYTPIFRVTDSSFRYHQKQLSIHIAPDCNANAIDDLADISGGASQDCDGNSVPDECDPDGDGDGIPDACDNPWTEYCFGDASAAACPCANFSAPGANEGCVNSTGIGAHLTGAGLTQPNSLELMCTGVPANQLCMLLQSAANTAPGAIVGDGIGCLGASTPHFSQKRNASAGGAVKFEVRGEPPGQVRFYQVSYRDPASFCTPSDTNRSNALEVHW